MKIGIDASAITSKCTGTSRYLKCVLDRLEMTSNLIIPFNAEDDFVRNRISSRIKKAWYRNYKLSDKINNSDTDCVIFPDYYMPKGVSKRAAIIIHDLSFISHPYFYPKYFSAYYNYQIKRTLKQYPVIATVSEHTKHNIVKYLNVKADDIVIVQGYAKRIIDYIDELEKYNCRYPYLLYVGHIEPRKNINFMIEGFLRWKEKTGSALKLKIIGELWIRTRSIDVMINKYSGNPGVEFIGYVTEEDLHDYYVNAAGFIHTSIEEGFGFPVLEAMNYNLPILCSDKIATAEISGDKSVKVDPANIESYYEGLERLSEIIRSSGRVNYEINYIPEKTDAQLEVLLERLDNKKGRLYIPGYPKSSTYEEALEKTLLYASIFNSGIPKDKLHQQIFDVKMGEVELNKIIIKSQLKGKILVKNDSLYIDSNENGFYSKKKFGMDRKKVAHLLHFLNKLPLTSMISFSGGTSHYGFYNHDDIDLFIITKPNAVFIVYLIIHIYAFIIRARKELCANYLIDETNLNITHAYDFYTAHQIITLIPFKNAEMLNRFWKRNEWVRDFFPNFIIENAVPARRTSQYYFLKPVNIMLMSFYRKLYKNKINSSPSSSSLILMKNCLKLHTNDHREKIITEFQKRLYEYYTIRQRKEEELAEAG